MAPRATATSRHEARMRVVTTFDARRLRSLVESRRAGRDDGPALYAWEELLDCAVLTTPQQVSPQVVTIHSRVHVLDVDARTHTICTLVFPGEAAIGENMISVLTPLGWALLGRSVGDFVTCDAPGGGRLLKIIALLYQPEAVGDYER